MTLFTEEEVFAAALQKPRAERATFLDRACQGDSRLRAGVEALLAAHDAPDSFLAAPLAEATIERPLEHPGAQIGPYKLLQQIGEGGFGVVFMAEQTEPVRRRVALKVIKPGMDTRQVIARFEAERQALAVMDHPNIAKVLDAGATESGRPYFVMELVHGTPITQYCDENNLSVRERLALFTSVCQAIQHSHTKGIIHRDIKATNVLVTRQDGQPVVKVIDFGIAKALGQQLTDKTLFTEFAQMIGTPLYMSPEQAELSGADIDTRSDIYSLGVLLYELLTGSTPVSKEQLKQAAFDEIRRIIREDEPPKPSNRISTAEAAPSIAAHRHTEPAKLTKLVRGELDWIVMKALEKDRSRRYETASGFAADVQHYLNDEPVVACPPSAAYRLRKFARRNRGRLAAAAIVAAALLVAVSGIGWAVRDRQAREADIARERISRRTKLTAQVDTILAEADRLMAQQKWPEALETARRAEAVVGGGEAANATVERVRQSLQGIQFVDELERIRMQRDTDDAHTDAEYAFAFRTYGVDLDLLPVATSIDRLKAEPAIVIPVAAALDEWAGARRRSLSSNEAHWKRLIEIARGIDPEPMRDRIRETRGEPVDQVRDELRRLVAAIDVQAQQPGTLDLLARMEGIRYTDTALRLLREAQHRHPGDIWLLVELAGTLEKRQDHEGAIRYYTAALAIRPSFALAHNNLGNIFRGQNKLDEALHHYQKAIEFAPQLAAPYSNLGNVLVIQEKFDDAIAAHRKAIELDPQLAIAHTSLGNALLYHNKLDEAIASHRRAIELAPKNPDCHNNLGANLHHQKKLAEAADAFRKAIACDPEYAHPHANLGLILLEQAKLAEASEALQRAIDLDPKSVAASTWGRLGSALGRQEDWAQASIAFRRQVEREPSNANAYANLGSALSNQGNLDEAVAAFRTAIARDPQSDFAYLNFGITLTKRGTVDEGIAAVRSFLGLKPNGAGALEKVFQELHSAAWKLAIDVERARREASRAVHLAEEAIRLKPHDVAIQNTLGVALYRADRWKEAIAALERSMELNEGGDAFDWFFLAMAHRRLGQHDKARQWYDRAVEWMDKHEPENEELGRFREEAARLLELSDPMNDGSITGM
jgi:serine/threonine protein kinase/tetratricopeptide (TPR) repeat protein